MSKKLIKLLRMITTDLKEAEIRAEEILEGIPDEDPDLALLSEELSALENSNGMNEDELDILKSFLVYILMKKGLYDAEEIYALIFGGGKRIQWN